MRPAGVATALYGWMERYKRDGADWDWRSLYTACAESGVDAVETDPTAEKLAILRDLGLAVSASYVGLPLSLPYEELNIEGVVVPVAERLAGAGGRILRLNADPTDWKAPARKTDDDARRQGDNLSRIAARVAPLGVATALHNHAAEHEAAQKDLESVVLHADPAVGLCVDTGWAHVAQHDPLDWFRAYPDRIAYLHLRNQRGAVPTEDLLEGDLDIPALLDALPDYRGWLTLELWHPDTMTPQRSLAEDTRRSVDYLRSLVGAR